MEPPSVCPPHPGGPPRNGDAAAILNMAAQWGSDATYSAISQALPDPCGITRISDGRYIEVNHAFCAMYGAPREQIVGRSSDDLGIWNGPEERDRLLHTLQRDGKVDRLSVTARMRGRPVPGVISASPVDVMGEACMVFVFHDVTHEQEVYESLLGANALLMQAGHMAGLGAWECDAQGALQHWSDTCCEVHGMPLDMPPPPDYIETLVAPAHRERVRAAMRAALRDGTPWTLELEIVRMDTGEHRWVRVHGEPVREGTRTLQVRGVLQDIHEAHRAEQALRDSQEHFQQIFLMLPYPMGICRRDNGAYIDLNPAWEEMTGFSRDEALGRNVLDLGLYDADERARLHVHTRELGELTPIECTLHPRNGSPRAVLQVMRRITLAGVECWLFALHDITERKRAEEAMREREAVLSLTLQASSLGVWDCNLLTGVITGDARWHALRGAPDGPYEFLTWSQCIGAGDRARMAAEVARHAREPQTSFDLVASVPGSLDGQRWVRSLGKIVAWTESGAPSRMLGVAIDVTGQREQELSLQRMAHYDALTDLPNRVLMARRLADAMAEARASGQLLGVAYLDLDGFKPVNDRFGHDGGDQLLRTAARRLIGALRPHDCVARLGGDEFAILLPALETRGDVLNALERVMRGISAPYDLDGESVSITASIGYTLFPRDDADADTLLRHADQAMYAAKQAGRNRCHEFDAAQEREARQARDQVVHMRDALAAGQFELYLQPKVDMRLGTVVGAEALARWHHPERGVLPPAEFLPLIEGAELDTRFGAWVVQTGLQLIETLCLAGLPIPLSLNIAAPHLQQPGFAQWMAQQLAEHPRIPPTLLDIEITETAALFQLEAVAQTLGELRALGVSVSLDDFGTGYSSLTYLRRLPLTTLKIDQSFVNGMMDEAGDLAIVQGVIGLARSFGYRVIAEGVETEDQGQMLLQMGCAHAQGYVIARPMPAREFSTWAAHWRAPAAWRR